MPRRPERPFMAPSNHSRGDASTPHDRADRIELLEHDTRRGIVEALEATPGLNQHQLARAVGTSARMVQYHLEKLLDAGAVLQRDSAEKKEWLYFLPEDEPLWRDERTRILFGREGVRRVAMFLAAHPGATNRDIADALDLTVHAVRWHTGKLQDHKLAVKAEVDGRQYEYHATSPLLDWARTVGPRYEANRDWALSSTK